MLRRMCQALRPGAHFLDLFLLTYFIWPILIYCSHWLLRWEAPAGSQVSFAVPDNWKSGRIWVSRPRDHGWFILTLLYCSREDATAISPLIRDPILVWLVDVTVVWNATHIAGLSVIFLTYLDFLAVDKWHIGRTSCHCRGVDFRR